MTGRRMEMLYRDVAGEGSSAPLAAVAAPPGLDVEAAVRDACSRVAPLWPLPRFVAVNPFLGLAGRPFGEACAELARVAGARTLMPRAYYRERLAAGLMGDEDLRRAIEGRGSRISVEGLRLAAGAEPAAGGQSAATVAEVVDAVRGTRWAPRAVAEVAKWWAAYHDRGQAAWPMPWRGERPFAAWRAAAALDRTPEALGLAGFRALVGGLPDDPVRAVGVVLGDLALPRGAVAAYLHRALASLGGWAAYARHLGWEEGLRGGDGNGGLADLLAARLAWDRALHGLHRGDAAFRDAWRARAESVAAGGPGEADLEIDLLLQEALERAYQRRLLGGLAARGPEAAAAPARPVAQAAFCIDVRSEVYRRALEAAAAGERLETVGFAGFFGFAIEHVPLGRLEGEARCPALFAPPLRVWEGLRGASPGEEGRVAALRRLRVRAARAWGSFRASAVSCFAYVEAAGLLFGPRLVSDGLGWTRPAPLPGSFGLDRDAARRTGPTADGIGVEQRAGLAEGMLRAMSLDPGRLARLVLLCGHGSGVVNNPHAAGLGCGACGGHAGDANARLAAAVLNDPATRAGLAARGLAIPDDTWFLAGLHDTATDEVRLFDEDATPPSHAGEMARLRGWLGAASRLARAERAPGLGVRPEAAAETAALAARARDWSQTRPEWGLAGNAAFVAAPRARTAGLDLGGRAFLHDYDHRRDATGSVLELILTAPVVVASWINLQYYGSTVDNAAFGAGDKVLHNVVGATVGVVEGNGGDLRAGLPWQSVHDGRRFVHEPLRLTVLVEAPAAAIDRVLAGHRGVRELVANGWLHLLRMGEEGGGGLAFERHVPGSGWRPAV